MLISAVTHRSLLYLQYVIRTEQWNAVFPWQEEML